MEETKVTHTSNILFKKGVQKDTYGWDIRIADDDLNKAVEEIERINNLMKKKFKLKRGGN